MTVMLHEKAKGYSYFNLVFVFVVVGCTEVPEHRGAGTVHVGSPREDRRHAGVGGGSHREGAQGE